MAGERFGNSRLAAFIPPQDPEGYRMPAGKLMATGGTTDLTGANISTLIGYQKSLADSLSPASQAMLAQGLTDVNAQLARQRKRIGNTITQAEDAPSNIEKRRPRKRRLVPALTAAATSIVAAGCAVALPPSNPGIVNCPPGVTNWIQGHDNWECPGTLQDVQQNRGDVKVSLGFNSAGKDVATLKYHGNEPHVFTLNPSNKVNRIPVPGSDGRLVVIVSGLTQGGDELWGTVRERIYPSSSTTPRVNGRLPIHR